METLVVIAAAKPDDFTNTVLNHVLVKLDHIPQVGERFVKPVTLQWIFFITCTCKIARLMTHGLIWHVATMPACAKITTKGVGWWLSTCPINGGGQKKVVHSHRKFYWANISQWRFPTHGVPLFDLFLSPCSSYWSDLKPPGSIQPHPTNRSIPRLPWLP